LPPLIINREFRLRAERNTSIRQLYFESLLVYSFKESGSEDVINLHRCPNDGINFLFIQ